MKKIVIIVLGVLVIAALAFVLFWKNGFFESDDTDTTILRNDLPPAPAGYETLNEDPSFIVDIPPEMAAKYREGFTEIVKTIKEHPDSFGAWFNLGAIKSVFGDYKGAEEAWLYATQISPTQARSLLNLGDLYRNKLMNYERAEWAYTTAIERKDASTDPVMLYRELASLYRNSYTSKKDLAMKILEQGISANFENDSELYALAGMWAWEDSDFEKAEAFYVKYLEKSTNKEEARKDLERIRRREPLP